MKQIKLFDSGERGTTLVEFAIALMVFMTAMFAVIEFGRALWVHYAVLNPASNVAGVKNVVVYGDPAGGTQTTVPNLTPDQVTVTYSNFALNHGTATVSIEGYQFQFVIPIVGTAITMPKYTTTLPGESVGLVPANL
jgi:hypothetical protein